MNEAKDNKKGDNSNKIPEAGKQMDETWGFPGGVSGKESACQSRRHKRRRFNPWVTKIPWRRAWQITPVFLPGEFHGQRSLVGYSPWSHKKLDTTEQAPMGRNGYFVSWTTDLAYLKKLDLETETKKQLKKIRENKEQFIFLHRNAAQMAQELLYQVLMKIVVKKGTKNRRTG